MNYNLIVIGGGPAGIMGAYAAAAAGMKCLLLEKNDRLGKKLSITGGGRCNLTNLDDMEGLQKNIITNRKFLLSSLYTFDNHHLIRLLESRGLTIRVEPNNRVFPASNKSSDVISTLQKLLADNNVKVKLNTGVKEIIVRNKQVYGVCLEDKTQISASKILICTGGMSYKQTGSTGDGHKMARSLGHHIIEPRPALVPLETKETWPGVLQGLSLSNVTIQALVGNKVKFDRSGEILFTHFGISGPAILNLSSMLSKYLHLPITLNIDIKPGFSSEELDRVLQKTLHQNSGKHLKNSLHELLPQRLIPEILKLAGVKEHKQVDQITKEERKQLIHTMKNVVLTVKGTRPLNQAIVTSGGVSVKEINPSTLESRIIKGLYFAGEILDVDALTGGYNLQIAWSTGYLSGTSAAQSG